MIDITRPKIHYDLNIYAVKNGDIKLYIIHEVLEKMCTPSEVARLSVDKTKHSLLRHLILFPDTLSAHTI